MSIQSDIFAGMAQAEEAAAKRLRGYTYNVQDQHQAEAHQAKAVVFAELAIHYIDIK